MHSLGHLILSVYPMVMGYGTGSSCLQMEPDFFSKPAIPECGGNVKLHSLHKASNLQAAVGNEIAFHWILLPCKN